MMLRAFAFGAVLALGGCAGSPATGLSSLVPLALRSDRSAQDLSAAKQDTLYLGIVDGLVKQGRHSAALAFLDGYGRSGAELSPRYWLLRGNALLGLHRYDEATQAFGQLHGTQLAAQGWNGLGRIAAEGKNWGEAYADFRKAVDGDPTNADFLNNLAFADLNLDNAEGATAWLSQAHELSPGSERILTNLAIALTVKGEGTRAETLIASIKSDTHRDAVRALVRSTAAALAKKGIPS